MLTKLLPLFIIVPLVELLLLIEIGKAIGTLEVIGLTVVTGMAGAVLAKSQGLLVIRKVQLEMSEGRMPTGYLIDGVMILTGGILLLTPGVLTDLIGLLLLIPWTRHPMKKLLLKWIRRKIEQGRFRVPVDRHPWNQND